MADQSPLEQAAAIYQECEHEANAMAVIVSVTSPGLSEHLDENRGVFDAGVAVGIAAALAVLERRGFLIGETP